MCAASLCDGLETVGNGGKGNVSAHWLKLPASFGTGPPQWLRQTHMRVTPISVVARRALRAELATADGMVRVATDLGNHTPALDDGDSTGVVTIPWTGRAYRALHFVSRPISPSSDIGLKRIPTTCSQAGV